MAKRSVKASDQRTVPGIPAVPPSPAASLPLPQIIEPLTPSLPRWKRSFDSKSRKKVAKILVLKMSGLKAPEIAKRLGTTPETIRHYMWLAGKNGWLSQDGMELVDPSEDLAFNAAHKVVRNINSALDGKPLKDQQFLMTVETAKGIGLFKTHQATKIEGSFQIPALEVNIHMPDALRTALPAPQSDTMGGVGNYIEGSVEPSGE